jgi:hypothetical protein
MAANNLAVWFALCLCSADKMAGVCSGWLSSGLSSSGGVVKLPENVLHSRIGLLLIWSTSSAATGLVTIWVAGSLAIDHIN